MAGNVLFENNSRTPPAVIDLTLYWSPAKYADAIILAGGLSWHVKGTELIQIHGLDKLGKQILVRALHWRYLTWVIDPDPKWVLEKTTVVVQRYIRATDMVLEVYGAWYLAGDAVKHSSAWALFPILKY